ncbi:MAG: acyl-CoA dehydrogenase, partial [Actinobacteria bacterium]|nr:acyl-CoA dehydrogenase [Actinomycetota bacterium]
MQPKYPAEAESYRDTVRAFLAEKLPQNWKGIGQLDHAAAETFTKDWRKVLYEAGYLATG